MPVVTNKIPVACFAPPLTDEKLAEYETLINSLDAGEVKDAMQECLTCTKAWWDLPESTRTDGDKFQIIHQKKEKTYSVTPLEKEHVKQLDLVTPYTRECVAMQPLFEKLDPVYQRDLRNAAFHLLSYSTE